MNAEKATDQNGVAPVAIPVRDEDAVENAFLLVADQKALPLARAIVDKRNMATVVRAMSIRTSQGSVDQDLVARAVDIGPAQTMRGRNPVDFCCSPRFTSVTIRGEDRNDSLAVLGFHGELIRHRDGWEGPRNTCPARGVYHVREVGRQDVALPGRILEPH